MGREVRRVPATWQHPKNENGHHIPLFGRSYSVAVARWDEEAAQWENGFRRDYQSDGWTAKDPHHTYPFEDWDGPRPTPESYMPDWSDSERTHWQMYETCSEGTPISPVMDTPEKLARWLADSGASAFGGMTASYEGWLATIQSEHGSVGMLAVPGGPMISGVDAMARK